MYICIWQYILFFLFISIYGILFCVCFEWYVFALHSLYSHSLDCNTENHEHALVYNINNFHLDLRQSDTNKEQPPGPAAQDMLLANLMFSVVTLCNSLRRSKHCQYYVKIYKRGVTGEGRKWRNERLRNLFPYLNRLRSVLEISNICWAHDEVGNRLTILVKKPDVKSLKMRRFGLQ
jgi:hypothetical protein